MSNRSPSALSIVEAKSEPLFRQTRVENERAGLSLRINGTWADLRNWSRTGIGFEVPQGAPPFHIGQQVSGVAILSSGIPVYEGEIEIRVMKPIDGAGTFYGAALTTALLQAEGIEAASRIGACFADMKRSEEAIDTAKAEVCQSVLALTAALRKIRNTCQEEEERWKSLPYDRRQEAERVFVPHMAARVRDFMVAFNMRVGKQIDVERLPENSIYHRMFHDEIFPFFLGADLARRAYDKPRGYAGDYEMMNQIYRNSYEGVDLFGKILHNYVANENSGNSVRFRKPYFLKFYRELLERDGKSEVLSVASGPSVEYQEAVATWKQQELDKVHVTLFDLDKEALEHAQTRILDIAMHHDKRPNVSFVNASVKRFLVSSVGAADQYDLIYSGGLFDYIDNPTATALTQKLAERLRPGGTLIIGNFTKDNTAKAFLHLITNWSLIHKTEDEMRAWASGLTGYDMRIDYDEKRINAFLVLRKNKTS